MINKKRVGILAGASLGVLGLGQIAWGGGTATAAGPDANGFTSENLDGYTLPTQLKGVATTCNETTGKFDITWSFIVSVKEPELTTTLISADAGGLTPGRQMVASVIPTVLPNYRTMTFTGTATYYGTDSITQNVDFKSVMKNNIHPAGISGVETKNRFTVASPCFGKITTTTSIAPATTTTTTTIPSTNVPAGAGKFVALSPARLLDTRGPGQTAFKNAETRVVPVVGLKGVPLTAKAVVLNVTAVGASEAGYVTVFPSGTPPTASNLNLAKGQTAANLVTVPLASDGSVSVYTDKAENILIDVTGYYESVTAPTSAGRFIALDPVRLGDTRDDLPNTPTPGEILTLQVTGNKSVPVIGVGAVVLNVTEVGALRPGFVTVYPNGDSTPTASNINVGRVGETRANQVIVKLPANGRIDLLTDAGGDLLVDVAGYFTDESVPASASGLFVPVAPERFLNTRDGVKPPAGSSQDLEVGGLSSIPKDASAVVTNVTAVDGSRPDYVTTWPAGGIVPTVSTLNIDFAGQTVPNHAITKLSSGKLSILTNGGAHLLVDVLGWYSK